jgi:hypothetical protein
MKRVSHLIVLVALVIDVLVLVWAFDLRALNFVDAAILNQIRFNATLGIMLFGGGGTVAGWTICSTDPPESRRSRVIVSTVVGATVGMILFAGFWYWLSLGNPTGA